MKNLIQFPLEDGSIVLVEVEQTELEGDIVPAATPSEMVAMAVHTLEKSLDKIKPAIGVIISKLRDLSDPVDEVEVEFGLKLSAEAGAIIASAGTEGNFKVTLTWKREPTVK